MAKRTGRRRGRPSIAESTTFLPDFPDQVKAIAMRGLSDDEMAAVFGISPNLIQNWKAFYPSFAEAIEQGRSHADARVVQALFDNCIGYDYDEDVIVGGKFGADVLTVTKRKLGETSAQKYWLDNRQPQNWGQKVQIGGDRSPGAKPVGVAVRDETKQEVINSILNLVHPQPDADN